MLKDLFLQFSGNVSFLNIFQYISFRAVYAAVTALFISFLFGPHLIEKLTVWKAGQEIRQDGPRSHQLKTGTPTMGGILIILSVLVSVVLWQDLSSSYTWVVIVSFCGFGLIGFIDDYLKVSRKSPDGMTARFKFVSQILLSFAIVMYLYLDGNEFTTMLYLPFLKFPVLDLSLFFIPLGVLLLVFTSNAVNLTDGLDGLATGLVLLVVSGLSILVYLSGRADFTAYLNIPYIPLSAELTIFCMALAGACIGFLWYNTHPAEIFMGDTGSLALGGAIGVIALLIKKEVLLFIIGGVFVLEAFSVIIQVVSFRMRGKRVFKMAPLHHHFELSGWHESKVVIRFWILGGLFVLLSLSTLKLQ